MFLSGRFDILMLLMGLRSRYSLYLLDVFSPRLLTGVGAVIVPGIICANWPPCRASVQ